MTSRAGATGMAGTASMAIAVLLLQYIYNYLNVLIFWNVLKINLWASIFKILWGYQAMHADGTSYTHDYLLHKNLTYIQVPNSTWAIPT